MRIRVLSDLHLEFGPIDFPGVQADVVVLAGDIHLGVRGLGWIQETFPNSPVVYVLGNHEYYKSAYPKLLPEFSRLTIGTPIHVLENQSVYIADTWFLGCTLWTDFTLDSNPARSVAAAVLEMADFRNIRISPTFRRLTPTDVAGFHRASRQWLLAELGCLRGQRIVIVTHHAPSPRSLRSEQRASPLAASFANSMDDIVESSNALLWVHGHTHTDANYQVGVTRVVSNQYGYPDELVVGFEADLVVDL